MRIPLAMQHARRLVLTALLFAAAGSAQAKTLLYRQTFGTDKGTNLASQGITEWSEVYTTTGSGAAGDNNLRNTGNVGPATDVNFGPATGTAAEYYQQNWGFYGLTTNGTPGKYALSLYTSALKLDPATNTYTLTWYQKNSGHLSQSVRVLVQVGGTWYVSRKSFQTELGKATPESFVYAPAAAEWFVLSTSAMPTNSDVINGRSDFVLSAVPSSDLSGEVTAFGFLCINPWDDVPSYLAIDSISVYGENGR